MDDLDFAKPRTQTNIDPLFANADDLGTGERRAGFEPVAPFADSVLKVVKTDARLSSQKGTPSVVLGFEVLEHVLESEEGRQTGPIDFYMSAPQRKEGESDKEYKERSDAFVIGVNRMKSALGLTGYPSSVTDVEALKAWISPAEGKTVIADLQVDRKGDQPRNRIWMSSFDAPNAPVFEKKAGQRVQVPNTNALENARKKIKVAREKAAQRSATAGGRKRSGPNAF